MKLRTTITIPKMQKIQKESNVLILGSCFAEYMHQQMSLLKLPTIFNPYGVTYNPSSIATQIIELFGPLPPSITRIENKPYPFSHHGSFRLSTFEKTEQVVLQSWSDAKARIDSCTDVIITLGSAYAWFRKDTLVNNCHKRSSHEFSRILLSIETIVTALENAFSNFPASTTITCTVSPIRHIRDGIIENNLSKSFLRSAIHILSQNDKRIQYFPSYEIMMDDLRDYRFYQDDLLHPTSMAKSYIWEQVRTHMLSKDLFAREEKVLSLRKRLNHRPRYAHTADVQRFLAKTTELLEEAQTLEPQLDWSIEKDMLTSLLQHAL